ncbi:MAG: aminopeptidase [Thermodesulfobacteriota bacterium]|nr:aminopeptidase [Thermodesulfobacteriota bacterium]
MFSDAQLSKYADVLLWGLRTSRKGTFKKNDVILIRYDLAGIRLAEFLQEKIIDRGMHVVLRMTGSTRMEHTFYKKANDTQLIFQPPGEKILFENLNGNIYLHAPESLTHLSDIDPKKIGKVAVSRKFLRDIMEKREEMGMLGWTLCGLPTNELAKWAKLSMRQYANQIIKACYLDTNDPVKEWKMIYKDALAVKKWMNTMEVKYYHVQSKNIDLKITPGGKRKWIGISGHNIPSFEIFLSPDWRGTEGVYYANQPSFRSGNYVDGVRIEFKRGKAVRVEARKGEDFVIKQLSIDKGACQIGEFSLTDKRFSKIDKFMASTLYDENYGGRHGNCHIALGSSYSDTYDGNPAELTKEKKKKLGFNDSALHWDLVNTEEKVVSAMLASGERVIIYEGGMFKY